jgi:hypothetical protein
MKKTQHKWLKKKEVKTNFNFTYSEVSWYMSPHRFPCLTIYILFYFSGTVPAFFTLFSMFSHCYIYYYNFFRTPHCQTLTPPNFLVELHHVWISFFICLIHTTRLFFCPLLVSFIFLLYTIFFMHILHWEMSLKEQLVFGRKGGIFYVIWDHFH